jgi:hypothetical protein
MSRETQESIGRWAKETFPGGDDLSRRHFIRLLEEVAELCYAVGCHRAELVEAVRKAAWSLPDRGLDQLREPEPPEKIAAEIADSEIVLRVLAWRRGINLDECVDAKMAINRARRWRVNGDGTGYHVKDGAAPSPTTPTPRGDDRGPMTDGERSALEYLEHEIVRSDRREVRAVAFREIRDRDLYRGTHPTFDEYLMDWITPIAVPAEVG